MGYRLEIKLKNQQVFYGTKHYGYCNDEEYKLESFKYLVSIGKMEEDTWFGGISDYETELTADEFKKFITLYSEEIKEKSGYDLLEKIQDIINNKDNKVISWG